MPIVLRLVGLLLLLAVALSVGAWLITGERRYSVLAVRLLKIGVALGLVFMALILLERLLAPML